MSRQPAVLGSAHTSTWCAHTPAGALTVPGWVACCSCARNGDSVSTWSAGGVGELGVQLDAAQPLLVVDPHVERLRAGGSVAACGHPQAQTDALTAAGCVKVFTDHGLRHAGQAASAELPARGRHPGDHQAGPAQPLGTQPQGPGTRCSPGDHSVGRASPADRLPPPGRCPAPGRPAAESCGPNRHSRRPWPLAAAAGR